MSDLSTQYGSVLRPTTMAEVNPYGDPSWYPAATFDQRSELSVPTNMADQRGVFRNYAEAYAQALRGYPQRNLLAPEPMSGQMPLSVNPDIGPFGQYRAQTGLSVGSADLSVAAALTPTYGRRVNPEVYGRLTVPF